MKKTDLTDTMRQAYIEFNGADYVFFGVVDTDYTTLRAVQLTIEEFTSWTTPSLTSDGQDSLKIRFGRDDVFNFLQCHVGRVRYVGKLDDMLKMPGKNKGEKFEAYIIQLFGWTPTPKGSAWYETGDAIDETGLRVQIGFNGKTVCHAGHLETLGLI